jgi:hypothetical protein
MKNSKTNINNLHFSLSMTDVSKLKRDLTSVTKDMYTSYLQAHKERVGGGDTIEGRIKVYICGTSLSIFSKMALMTDVNLPWRSYVHKISSMASDIDSTISMINSLADIQSTDPGDFDDFLAELENDQDLQEGFPEFASEARACKGFIIKSMNRDYAPDEIGAHLMAMGYYTSLRHMQKLYSKPI